MKTDNLIAFNVGTALNGYTPVRSKQFFKQFLDRVSALPGVSVDGLRADRILEGNEWDSSMSVEGYEPKPGENMNPFCNAVSPGYFKTMEIPLVAGRDFDDRDARYVDAKPDQNASCPHSRWPSSTRAMRRSTSAIAARSAATSGSARIPGRKTPIEIIGVVKDAKYMGVRDEIPRTVYFAFMEDDFAGGAVMYVRTSSRPDAAFGAVREVLRQLDPNVPMVRARTMERSSISRC